MSSSSEPCCRRRRVGVIIVLVGLGLALALNESTRMRVLDLLFGNEEEFVYTSATQPSA